MESLNVPLPPKSKTIIKWGHYSLDELEQHNCPILHTGCNEDRKKQCAQLTDYKINSGLPPGRCNLYTSYWKEEIRKVIPKSKRQDSFDLTDEEWIEYEKVRHEQFKKCKWLKITIEVQP